MQNSLIPELKTAILRQFGASIDMLENAILACPDDLWDTERSFSHLAYHTLFFLDYYLSLEPVGFSQPTHFKHSEFEDEPAQEIFAKAEILEYLQSCRTKMQDLFSDLTENLAQSRWINESKTMDYSIIEIALYNLRHVQHHAGQLNLMLRQNGIEAPDWVFRAGFESKL
jgi:uncharacterized damage-inducible protein DinB